MFFFVKGLFTQTVKWLVYTLCEGRLILIKKNVRGEIIEHLEKLTGMVTMICGFINS